MIEHSKAQVANAREEQQMRNENETQTEAPRTANDFIQEAARYVNWKPDLKHSQQARYDALSALMHIHAYSAAVALETLRRVDPDAAERVAKHLGRDDWDLYCENAWIWNDHLAKGEPIDPDGHVFPKLAGPDADLIRALLADPHRNDHILQIDETGWTLQHPVIERCTGELFDCHLGQETDQLSALWDTHGTGRYVAWLTEGVIWTEPIGEGS